MEAESRRGRKGKEKLLLLLPAQLDPGHSDGAPGGARRLLRNLNLGVQPNRPLIQGPNLFLRIRAARSMSAYGNESVSQRSSEGPTSTFLGQTLAYRERFHADRQVRISLLPPEHKSSYNLLSGSSSCLADQNFLQSLNQNCLFLNRICR